LEARSFHLKHGLSVTQRIFEEKARTEGLRASFQHSSLVDSILGCQASSNASLERFRADLNEHVNSFEDLRNAIAANLDGALHDQRLSNFRGEISDYGSSIFSSTELFRSDTLVITLQSVDGLRFSASRKALDEQPLFEIGGVDTIVRIVSEGSATVSILSVDAIDDDSDLTKPINIQSLQDVELDSGSGWLAIESGRQGFRLSYLRGNPALLYVSIPNQDLSSRVVLDSRSGEIKKIKPLKQLDSKILMLLDTLARQRGSKALPSILPFVDHQSFFVRWHALRLVAALDRDGGLEALGRREAKEANPVVRRGISRLRQYLEEKVDA
jgi:hypothetical protein